MATPAQPTESRTPSGAPRAYDLADHFLDCAKLGRFLTAADGSRFIITDDFRGVPILHEAAAVAALYSRDMLVARAAILPLGGAVPALAAKRRAAYEELFGLIGAHSDSPEVRTLAAHLMDRGFRPASLRAVEADLSATLNPARLRYRDFLATVRLLIDRRIGEAAFMDEFRAFTAAVAGKLDFGIYSYCLDNVFRNLQVPIAVKKLLVLEFLKFPPLVRRELLSNVLAYAGQAREVISFVKSMVAAELDARVAMEIELLEGLKRRRFTMRDMTSIAAAEHLADAVAG